MKNTPMRDIKFRVWNGETMISPDCVDRKGYGHWVENSIPSMSNLLMQFTGSKDSAGVDIYESDINQDFGIVIWVQDSASYCWKYPNGDIHEFGEENEWCKIIGNFYLVE